MKPKYQNQKKEYDKLNKRLKDYSDRSELLLGSLNEEVAASISTLDIDEDVFRFKDYTQLNKISDSIRNAFVAGLWGLISSGIDTEWANADSNAKKLISNASSVYSEDFIGKYNELASDAFKKRNAGGLTISQRIWRRYYDYRDFLEASISASISKGMNAGEVKREITNDLQNIDALRVKYKDRYGSVPNIKDVRYYVSRLVTSEINMAYRECEQQRWRQLGFVLGFKINLSGAHKERDICDDLAGVYPKSFKWYGWHPLDRCYMTPVLMSDMEFWEWNNGGKKSGEITDVPQNFKQWINKETFSGRSSLPFFITDNPLFTGITKRMYGNNGFTGTKLGRQATKEAYKVYAEMGITKIDQSLTANTEEIAKLFKTTAHPMTFFEANNGNANFDFGKSRLFSENCQSCVIVHEARLRGLNITALPYSAIANSMQSRLSGDTALAWFNSKGLHPFVTHIKGKDEKEVITNLLKASKSKGRYHIGINFTNNTGHIIVAERFNDGKVFFFDAQNGLFVNIYEYKGIESLELLKVDKLLIDPAVITTIARLL